MRYLFLAVSVWIMIIANVQAEGVYRWVDKSGKVQYGDRPAEDAEKSEQKKFSGTSSKNENELSYSVRKAQSDFPVKLYVMPSCGEGCNQARTLLNKRGVPFEEFSLVTKEDFEAFTQKVGGKVTPTILIGKTLLGGFNPEQLNSELDIAGYLKAAPYGYRPQAPVEPKKILDPANPYK